VISSAATRAGSCALVGPPNVGKSTLLNAILGQKLAITTPTPQTTRTNLLGVYESEDPPTQISFLDTPGLHKPQGTIGRKLHEEVKGAMAAADVFVLLVDAPSALRRSSTYHPLDDDPHMRAMLDRAQAPMVLALNKVDRIRDKSTLLPLMQRLAGLERFQAVVPISALRKTQIDSLIGEVRKHLPEGPMQPGAEVTNRSVRDLAAEFIREAVMLHTRQEVPHGIAVQIDAFEEKHTLTRIDATIIVNKENHKKIVLGAAGGNLKEIATLARLHIEELLQRKVLLKLWVKVIEGWTSSEFHVKQLVS
jgi:GTP-binding protein Era